MDGAKENRTQRARYRILTIETEKIPLHREKI